METGQLGYNPKEAYGEIIDKVGSIFRDDGLILTGSSIGILNGSSDDLTTHRLVYVGQVGRYFIQPWNKDIDLMVVSHTRLHERPDYFAEKAKALESEFNDNQRQLLDIVVSDPFIFNILEELGEVAQEFEKAHSEENSRALAEIRNYRNEIINGDLNKVGYLFAPLNIQPFVHCPDVPSGNQLHTHTTSLAAGNDYMVFGNKELSDKVAEASKSSYIPEELGETAFSAEAYAKLKKSNVGTIPEDIYQVFLMLARHEGFRRAEIDLGRKVVGFWDIAYGEHNVQGFKRIIEIEYQELFNMIYDQNLE